MPYPLHHRATLYKQKQLHIWNLRLIQNKSGIGRVQPLADISRSGYVVIATKPVYRLQIRPIVHNYRGTPYHSPKLHPGPRSSVGMRLGTDRHTDTQTDAQTEARDHYTFRVVYDSREL